MCPLFACLRLYNGGDYVLAGRTRGKWRAACVTVMRVKPFLRTSSTYAGIVQKGLPVHIPGLSVTLEESEIQKTSIQMCLQRRRLFLTLRVTLRQEHQAYASHHDLLRGPLRVY